MLVWMLEEAVVVDDVLALALALGRGWGRSGCRVAGLRILL